MSVPEIEGHLREMPWPAMLHHIDCEFLWRILVRCPHDADCYFGRNPEEDHTWYNPKYFPDRQCTCGLARCRSRLRRYGKTAADHARKWLQPRLNSIAASNQERTP